MLISAKRLAGAPLTGTDGRAIGAIREVVIDRRSGRVIYLLMDAEKGSESRSGSAKAYPLPWQLVTFDRESETFRLDADPEHLKRAPGADGPPPVDWNDRVWAERVHEHYGVQPHWTVRSGS